MITYAATVAWLSGSYTLDGATRATAVALAKEAVGGSSWPQIVITEIDDEAPIWPEPVHFALYSEVGLASFFSGWLARESEVLTLTAALATCEANLVSAAEELGPALIELMSLHMPGVSLRRRRLLVDGNLR